LGRQKLPVVYGASIIVVIAWPVSIKLAHANSPEQAIIRDHHLAFIIRCTLVKVITCSAKGWYAKADAKVSEFRLHFLAEAWSLVALSKVKVAIHTTGCARLTRRWDAAAFIWVATAIAGNYQVVFMHRRAMIQPFKLTGGLVWCIEFHLETKLNHLSEDLTLQAEHHEQSTT
jgi:hypothetical protein